MARALSRQLGFQFTELLWKYLGVPLIHKRALRRTYQYIVDKVQQNLNGWSAKNLSVAGRVIPAQSILAALPIYTMQTERLSRQLCDDI